MVYLRKLSFFGIRFSVLIITWKSQEITLKISLFFAELLFFRGVSAMMKQQKAN